MGHIPGLEDAAGKMSAHLDLIYKLRATQIILVLVVEELKALKHSGAAGVEWGLPAEDEDVLQSGTETVCY